MSEPWRRWLTWALFQYLMLYVTAQVIFDRPPKLFAHIVTWGVIALLALATWFGTELARRRR